MRRERRHRVRQPLAAATLAILAFACGGQPDTARTFESIAQDALSKIDGEIVLTGLTAEVTARRDRWGVPHIQAQSVEDLFFAQGFVVAQDRLWQMEMSRRTAQGRLAEIIGPSAVPHDRLVRLLKYRGPFDDGEWGRYHPDARRLFTAYTRGVNAFIANAGSRLPVEFQLTGIVPEPWQPEEILVRARISAAIGSARRELRLAQEVRRHGAVEANRRAKPDPFGELRVPEGLDLSLIDDRVIAALDGDLYGELPAVPLLVAYREWPNSTRAGDTGAPELSPGSNNWAVMPAASANGTAIMVHARRRRARDHARARTTTSKSLDICRPVKEVMETTS